MTARPRGAFFSPPSPRPSDMGNIPMIIAAAVIIDLPAKQALLAAPDAVSRLLAERALLAREPMPVKLVLTALCALGTVTGLLIVRAVCRRRAESAEPEDQS